MTYKITGKFEPEKIIALLEFNNFTISNTKTSKKNVVYQKEIDQNQTVIIILNQQNPPDKFILKIQLKFNYTQNIQIIFTRFMSVVAFCLFWIFYDNLVIYLGFDFKLAKYIIVLPMSTYALRYCWYYLSTVLYNKSQALKIQSEIIALENK